MSVLVSSSVFSPRRGQGVQSLRTWGEASDLQAPWSFQQLQSLWGRVVGEVGRDSLFLGDHLAGNPKGSGRRGFLLDFI